MAAAFQNSPSMLRIVNLRDGHWALCLEVRAQATTDDSRVLDHSRRRDVSYSSLVHSTAPGVIELQTLTDAASTIKPENHSLLSLADRLCRPLYPQLQERLTVLKSVRLTHPVPPHLVASSHPLWIPNMRKSSRSAVGSRRRSESSRGCAERVPMNASALRSRWKLPVGRRIRQAKEH